MSKIKLTFLGPIAILCSIFINGLYAAEKIAKKDQAIKRPHVLFTTSLGEIEVELFEKEAPKTVENFLKYVNDKHYDGTIFHRVIPGFMIQGGGQLPDMKEKATKSPIKNEANNGLRNEEGTLAMARTGEPHSATAQFFINVAQNDSLNFSAENNAGWGYAVFGKVVKGMTTVNKIKVVSTKRVGAQSDVPVEPVIILKAVKL